ncbi:MAG: hypothetical protein PXX77_04225 [Gallionella sp.]|nr:hypothetical protein [Gallionella sp.]
MLKKLFLSVVMMLAASSCLAGENAAKLEFTLVSVTDKVTAGKSIPEFSTNKQPRHIYVWVPKPWGWGKPYEKTTMRTQEMFRQHGVTLVDKKEDADVVLTIMGTSFDIDEVETNIDAGIDKERLAATIGSAFYTGGASLIGEMWRPSSGSEKSVVISIIFSEFSKVEGSEKKDEKNSALSSTIVYQSNKDGADTANAVYVSFVGKFLENHFPAEKQASNSAVVLPVSQAHSVTPAAANQN